MMERLTERFSNGQAAVYGCGNNCKYDYKYCNNHYKDCPTINNIYEKLAKYEDLEDRLNGISIEQVVNGFIKTVENQTNEDYEHGRILTNADAGKWNEYNHAEEQGLLLRLPCKVGDTVYILRKNIVTEEQVYDVQYRGITYQKGQRWYVNIGGLAYFEMDFGKYVFLTQAEAEQKLKEMESD